MSNARKDHGQPARSADLPTSVATTLRPGSFVIGLVIRGTTKPRLYS
jgi:hypothetical protein